MGLPLWFRGALWSKITGRKFPEIEIEFKEDGTIAFIPEGIKLQLCEHIAKVIYGYRFRKYIPRMTVLLTTKSRRRLSFNRDFSFFENSARFGSVSPDLVWDGFFHIKLYLDTFWKEAIFKTISDEEESLTIPETIKNHPEVLKAMKDKLKEIVEHETWHNAEIEIEGRKTEGRRYERLVKKHLGQLKSGYKMFWEFINRGDLNSLTIRMGWMISQLVDQIKHEGFAHFLQSPDKYTSSYESNRAARESAAASTERIVSELDELFFHIEHMLNSSFEDVNKNSILSRRKKLNQAGNLFSKRVNRKLIDEKFYTVQTYSYELGGFMAFTILAVFPDMSTEKIAKMSPRNFFWKYEEACKKVHVKPLATYDGDGILDIKKYIHKMKRVRNIALGRGEHAIV